MLKNQEQIALFRYGVIASLLSVADSKGTLKEEITALSKKQWVHPDGSIVQLSFHVIEHWYYDFKRFRLQGLMPKKRKDTGQSRVLNVAIQEEIAKRKKADPKLTTATIIRQLLEENKLTSGDASTATIYRFMHGSGLKDFTGKEKKERRAFEVSFPGELWQSDLMYGPYLSCGRKKRRTYLYIFIDDCTRVIPHAQFYFSESLASLVDCFKQAVVKRGIPYKLYTDNGKVFLSSFFNLICANLGIKLLHCEPFDAAAKGKVERMIRTIRQMFLPTIDIAKIRSINELNAKLHAWIEGVYHTKVHSSLGFSPLEKWLKNSSKIRMVKSDMDIDTLFLTKTNRTVTQDGCISLLGKRFEVDQSLVGQKIEVRYNPFNIDKVLIYFNDKFIHQALPLDLKLNAKFPRKKGGNKC